MIGADKVISILKEKEVVPIGLAVVLGYVLVWAVRIGDQQLALAQELKETKVVVSSNLVKYNSIDRRLSRIEWALKIKHKKDEDDE